jgi:hypothetical protein
MKVYDNQYVDAHSCMVRKQLFSSSELPTMQFRGLQELFLPFRNYNFIQMLLNLSWANTYKAKYFRDSNMTSFFRFVKNEQFIDWV